jgi:5-methylcytosine-specific restriction endonuclease McrA
MIGEAGKGDRYRPVDKKQFDENYERIFMKKKSPNHKSFRVKADELFMKSFRGTHCEICQTTKGTVGHHIIPKSRSKALRYDSRNIIVLCQAHHTMGNDMAPHATNQVAVERFIEWFKENKPAQHSWTKEHERDQRKFSYEQALENLKEGRLAWV